MKTNTLTEASILSLHRESELPDTGIIGAKARHLMMAYQNGFPVPPGIIIPTSVFSQYRQLLTEEDFAFPPTLEAAIMAALPQAGPGPYAVRSSAIAEDGDSASFAGQYFTQLNVHANDLADAVLSCWKSVFSERIAQFGNEGRAGMAVIIQQMVNATEAGVAFTANPVTGERNSIQIDAVKGLGEKLVSGETTPENLKVAADQIARQSGSIAVINDHQALQVSSAAQQLEQLFGKPQDVEWAFSGEEFFILQSRPITALPPEPVPVPINPKPGIWERGDHQTTVTPYDWDLWFTHYGHFLCNAIKEYGLPIKAFHFDLIGGQVYSRIETEGGDDDKAPPPKFILWLFSRLHPAFRKANRKAKEAISAQVCNRILNKWQSSQKDDFQHELSLFQPDEFPVLTDDELLSTLKKLEKLALKGAEVHADLGVAYAIALGSFGIFCKKHLGWSYPKSLELFNGSSPATSHQTRDLSDLINTHFSSTDLKNKADQIRFGYNQFLKENPAFKKAVEEWISEHGIRIQNYGLTYPTLGEQADVIWMNIQFLMLNEGKRIPEQSDQIQSMLNNAKNSLTSASLRDEFLHLYKWAKTAYGIRDENGTYTWAKPWGLLRLSLLEIGKRMEKSIGKAEHIFYLKQDEISPALTGNLKELNELITRRRGEVQWAKLNPGPKYYGGTPPPMPSPSAFPSGLKHVFGCLEWMDIVDKVNWSLEETNKKGNKLNGTGICAGEYTGIARVVEGPEDFSRINPGEIMVCRITSGEWATVFSRVGALVTDEGGLLSHPAIIAREFGIPAVVGTINASRRIRDGQRITVDGATGTVRLL